jgi:hypothetical protein
MPAGADHAAADRLLWNDHNRVSSIAMAEEGEMDLMLIGVLF